METITLSHKYNGTKIGQNSQDTKLELRGCVSVEAGIEMFKHFVATVWGRKLDISFVGEKKEETGACTRVIGFELDEQEEKTNAS